MIPSVVASQLRDTVAEYLRTTFSLRDAAYEQALLKHLEHPVHGLFRGPFVDVRLPFRTASPAEVAPLHVRPSFAPYAHQLRAWQRLSSAQGHEPRSTLVATGTGSGKTECFLFPILDHCLRHAGAERSVKAIILYPMNALASDQAGRLADLIHNWRAPGGEAPALRDRVTAGLYVGGEGSCSRPTSSQLVDMREHLRNEPPDILLTNYRMLDFLLMRPEDVPLWRNNKRDTLKYLVLDELHTYDGAQGTDVAFLLRRLRQRLSIPAGHLCCVGTSATIGGRGEAGRNALIRFASDVFAQPFDNEAIVGEDRLSIREALDQPLSDALTEPALADIQACDPGIYGSKEEYLRAQAQLWLGAAPTASGWFAELDRKSDGSAARVGGDDSRTVDPADGADGLAVAVALDRHPFLRDLMRAQERLGSSGPRDWTEIIAELPKDSVLHDFSREEQWQALSSFLSLIAVARRRSQGRLIPYLTVQIQLWVRELRRLLRRVPRTLDEAPAFAWADEIAAQSETQYAVQAYCRECGQAGFAMLQVEGSDELVSTPNRVGDAYLQGKPGARFIELGNTRGNAIQGELFPTRYLCPRSLNVSDSPVPCRNELDEAGNQLPIARIEITVHGEDRELEQPKFTRKCPRCQADDALSIMGSRAASLSSVAIGHIFQSPFNSDRKLLAFTDSVQDASHRAAFFAGRTFRFTLRTAVQSVIQAQASPMNLVELSHKVIEHWGTRFTLDGGQPGTLAATFLPPDLRDDAAYTSYMDSLVEHKREPSKHVRKDLEHLLQERLGWEIVREFGLGVVIGRSLEKTGCSVAFVDPERLDAAAEQLHRYLVEQRPIHHEGNPITPSQARHYLVGLTERMRTRGAVHHRLLDPFVKHGTRFWLSRRKAPRLSRFGPSALLPRFLFHGALHKIFDPVAAPARRVTWYRDWTARAFAVEPRDEGITAVLSHALELLVSHGVADTRPTVSTGHRPLAASGLLPSAILVDHKTARVACSQCGAARSVVAGPNAHWIGARCLTYRCTGSWNSAPLSHQDAQRHRYYRSVYTSDRVGRVFAEEHTGLLKREDREELEVSFRERNRPDAPNLLTCTPTLEMGIDIGDLSAVMLCSVPPLPANYIQRVGRAGRSTGNALVVTVANARPHDRYFFEQPDQMMRGDVEPPACFLDAPDMLKRQLVAHAMDYWAARTKETKLPRNMQTLLGPANTASFPHSFYAFYESNRVRITSAFLQAFGRDEGEHPGWADISQLIEQWTNEKYVLVAMQDAFDEVKTEIKTLGTRKKALEERRKLLQADPTRAHPNADDPANAAKLEIEDIEDAIRGYGRQAQSLKEKYPPNVLTDAGVLPNYAFPEPGVTLRATFRTPRVGTADGLGAKGAKHPKAEYQRPASAALREFAPFNSFYAEGRKIKINQIDLGTKNDPTIEHWRFCPECHHSKQEELGSTPDACCPACGSRDWCDAGQLRKLIAFRKAWSSSTLSEASTSDESDEREQENYVTRELIERDPSQDAPSARLIESGDVLFGYELWPRAQLREINFGRVRDLDVATQIAGASVAQRGFGVCRLCGRAQDGGRNRDGTELKVHAPWCRTKTSGETEKFEHVSLYREMTSEAIRVLLPVAQHEVQSVLMSFRAGLELGLRKKFGGQPLHLKITTMSEPGIDGRRQFLVLYDTVPGGTGYLAELWRGRELFDVMELAIKAMRECVCARGNSERDGCYRCVYAHQHQRDIASISRRRAAELFEKVVAKRDEAKEVASLSNVAADSLLESELERQFVSALRAYADRRGWPWMETVFKGANAWRFRVDDDLTWELRPQVNINKSDNVAIASRPDFVLVPISSKTLRKVAVFVDGFGYHVQPQLARSRIEDDIRKRVAILDVSDNVPEAERHWVWSLAYNDVKVALDSGPSETLLATQSGPAFLTTVAPQQSRTFAAFASKWPEATVQRVEPEHLARGSFDLLTRWLERPDLAFWRQHVVCALLTSVDLKQPRSGDVRNEFDALRERPDLTLPLALEADHVARGGYLVGVRANLHAVLAFHVPYNALSEGKLGPVEGVLRLNDTHEARNHDSFDASWRGFLQAWNLLQFHPLGFAVTSTERLQTDTRDDAGQDASRPALSDGATSGAQVGDGSALAVSIATIEEAQGGPPLDALYAALVEAVPRAEPLWRACYAAGLPAPEETIDVDEDDIRGVDDAAYVWLTEKVGLQAGVHPNEVEVAERHDWILVDMDSVDSGTLVALLLDRGET